jgi:hypothetical protein
MELTLWETVSRSDFQEFSNILWNPKVHYRVQKRPPRVLILIQTDPVYITSSYLAKIYFNIILPPKSSSSYLTFSSWFFHQNRICIPLLSTHATRPASLTLHELVIQIVFCEKYKLWINKEDKRLSERVEARPDPVLRLMMRWWCQDPRAEAKWGCDAKQDETSPCWSNGRGGQKLVWRAHTHPVTPPARHDHTL